MKTSMKRVEIHYYTGEVEVVEITGKIYAWFQKSSPEDVIGEITYVIDCKTGKVIYANP